MQANFGGFKSVGLAYKSHHGTGSFFFPHFGGGYEIVLFVHISGILLKIDHLSSPISSGTRQIPNFAVDFGERPHDAVEDLVGRFGFYLYTSLYYTKRSPLVYRSSFLRTHGEIGRGICYLTQP